MLSGGITAYLEGTLSREIAKDTRFPVGTVKNTDIE